ncbi:hypothetical protein ACFL3Z_01330 [Gemmatimonadota bacterium]
MRIALVLGILFLAGAVFNVFGPEPNLAEASAGLGISAALIGVFLFGRAAQQRDEEFLVWVLSNAHAIQDGGADHGGFLITPATVLTRYQVALSFLIVSFKVPSRYYHENESPPWFLPVLLTATTFVLGWWGIPWGPVYTVQVLARNLRGGLKETVGDLLLTATSQDAGGS